MGFGIRRAVLATATIGGLTLAFAATASAHVAAAPRARLRGGRRASARGHRPRARDGRRRSLGRGAGGRAVWALPASFVTVMVVGGALGSAGSRCRWRSRGSRCPCWWPACCSRAAVRLPVTLGMALTGVFALFHGHAHGIAMSAYAPAGSFAAGFVLATIMLHALGIALATALQRDPALRRSAALKCSVSCSSSPVSGSCRADG